MDDCRPKTGSPVQYINPDQPVVFPPAYQGKRYRIAVPDTLDLAERAALGVNALTETSDPDADCWIRNQFAEGQLTDCSWVRRMAAERPASSGFSRKYVTTDRVPERCVGSFSGWPLANDWIGMEGNAIMHCCTGNGCRTIYHAWENILSCSHGRIAINLLLNRASPWVDITSRIPFEGRVDVLVKEACQLSIRIPEWVNPGQARCQVDGIERALAFSGRYALVGPVEPGITASLTFPIRQRQDRLVIKGREYTICRKGNDVIAIDPPGRYGPYYQRDQYRLDKAAYREVERFVAEQPMMLLI
jgi:hypothetical protein